MTCSLLKRSTALAAFLSLPIAANAQNVTFWDLLNVDRLATVMVQSFVSVGRSFAEIRFVDLDIRPLDNHYMISGITVSPYDDERYPGCDIQLDRMVLSGASLLQTDMASVNVEVTGGVVPVTCLEPWDRDEFLAIGITEFAVDRGVIRAELIAASGAANIDFDIVSEGYGTLTGSLAFGYLSLDIDREVPIADLTAAHLEFTDDGLWALFEAEIPPFLTNEDMLVAMMSDELLPAPPIPEAPVVEDVAPPATGGGGKPGDTAPAPEPTPAPAPAPAPEPVADPASDAARAVIEDLAAAVAGFANEPGRIAVEITLDEPVRLTEDMFEDFAALAAALSPSFDHGPRTPVVAAPEIAAALAAAMAGDTLSDDDQRALGLALLTGDGVPRSPAMAVDVMAPLLEAGDAEALGALSDHYDLVPADQVYGFLHAAAAQGNVRAALALDRAERRLGLAGVLEAQGEGSVSLSDGDRPADLSALAQAALRGDGGNGRHYHDAYVLALLAEAGGDLSASLIVDTLDDRGRISDDPDLWNEMLANARNTAFELWLAANEPEPEPETEATEDATETDQ